MAYEIPGLTLTLLSSGDMSGNQYKCVRASSANADGGATLVAERGGLLTGVWQDNSTAATYGKVMFTGVSKVLAGGGDAITQGAVLVASSAGQAVPSTASGQHTIGFALESLSSDATGVIPVQLAIGAITT